MAELDVYFKLEDDVFVWNSEKAKENRLKHGIRFERACEVFHDRGVLFVDASSREEDRAAAIGYTMEDAMLFVVHIERLDGSIRIISARVAEPKERRLEDYMKTASERMREAMRSERIMTSISLRIPERMIEDLKEIAPMLGLSGYQSLIKLYISQGLRRDIQKLPGTHVAALTESLRKRGVAEADIAAAIKEAGLKTA